MLLLLLLLNQGEVVGGGEEHEDVVLGLDDLAQGCGQIGGLDLELAGIGRPGQGFLQVVVAEKEEANIYPAGTYYNFYLIYINCIMNSKRNYNKCLKEG